MRDFINRETLLAEDPERIETAFEAARRAADTLDVELRLPRTRPRPDRGQAYGRSRCDWPWSGAYVSYDGRAMPCCMVATPDRASFGNVFQRDLLPVWNGRDAEDFRARLDSEHPPEICQSCSVYHGVF
jgi:radical SAM protein with 4Fe4S-binding SPASM domain